VPEQINWGFWEVAVAVVVALVTAAWALRERRRRRKDLQYDLISKAPLVSVREEARGRIKILFDEEPVSNVSLAIIQIANRGSPIPSADFESPLTVSMGADSRIMSVEVMERQPDSLDVELTVENGQIQIEPLLLNNGDSFTLKVIGMGLSDNIELAGRIVGVKTVKPRSAELARTRGIFRLCLYPVIVVGIALVIQGVRYDNDNLLNIGAGLWVFAFFANELINVFVTSQ
jgi:hypothetical protein